MQCTRNNRQLAAAKIGQLWQSYQGQLSALLLVLQLLCIGVGVTCCVLGGAVSVGSACSCSARGKQPVGTAWVWLRLARVAVVLFVGSSFTAASASQPNRAGIMSDICQHGTQRVTAAELGVVLLAEQLVVHQCINMCMRSAWCNCVMPLLLFSSSVLAVAVR